MVGFGIWVDFNNFDLYFICLNTTKLAIVSVCVVGMVIGKIYFDVKANIDCDICYFDIVARISKLVVIKFYFWQSGLEDVLEEVPEGSGLEGVLEEVPEGVSV